MLAEAKAKSSGKRATPPVNCTARGDKLRGLEIARGPQLIDVALAPYQREVRSSGGPSDEKVKTWTGFHNAMCWARYGLPEDCPLPPLMLVKLIVIGSVFKESGDRSTKNYLSAIKKKHIVAGFSCAEQPAVAAQAFKASTGKGHRARLGSHARCRGQKSQLWI